MTQASISTGVIRGLRFRHLFGRKFLSFRLLCLLSLSLVAACTTKDPQQAYCHLDTATQRVTLYSDQPGRDAKPSDSDDERFMPPQAPENQVDPAGKSFFAILTVDVTDQKDGTWFGDQVIFPFGKKAGATFEVDVEEGICTYNPDLALLPGSTYLIRQHKGATAVAQAPTEEPTKTAQVPVAAPADDNPATPVAPSSAAN